MPGEMLNAALLLAALALLSAVIFPGMSALTTMAAKAERHAFITALVADRHEGAAWGTLDAPTTTNRTLPNGTSVQVTAWRETDATSTRLSAVVASNSSERAADCTKPSDIAKSGCVYASRVHAAELDAIEPRTVTRMDPSMIQRGAAAIGDVNAAVGRGTALAQGETIATANDTASAWRYLATARSVGISGELRISQAGRTLATIPVDAETGNYYGTLTVAPGQPVTVTVSAGEVITDTIYLYRAGASE